ncbi:MAG: ABC transporter permease subunit [Alphaproteobacteria bacterium]|nr:ABC transporter permease subunit [Alphaproteobacteria bacterium]
MVKRRALIQILLLASFLLAIGWLVSNVVANLQAQNISSGFGFLNERAGFGVAQSLIEYNEDSTYGRVLVVGLLNTLAVSIAGIILASLLGFVLGVARLSQNWIIAKLAAAYIEVFRNIPLLLQIFFLYFGVLRNLPSPRQSFALGEVVFLNNRGIVLPALVSGAGAVAYLIVALVAVAAAWILRKRALRIFRDTGQHVKFWTPLFGIITLSLLVAYSAVGLPFAWDIPVLKGFNYRGGVQMIPEFAALLLALSLYTAAFIAEIVRAGIASVSHGQSEAASALGLPAPISLRYVIIPQALRVIIPPLTSQYLNLTKNSSLAVAIAYPDIVSVFAGTSLSQVGQAVEIIFTTMMIYLALSLLTAYLMNRYNNHTALVGRNV